MQISVSFGRKLTLKIRVGGDCDFVLEQKIFGKIAVLFGVSGCAKKCISGPGRSFPGIPGVCVLPGKCWMGKFSKLRLKL